MTTQIHLAGSFTFPNTSMTVNRMGYGAMQLAGPEVRAILTAPSGFCGKPSNLV